MNPEQAVPKLPVGPQVSVPFKSVAEPLKRNDGIVLRSYSSLEDLKPVIDMMERDLSGLRVFSVFYFFPLFFPFQSRIQSSRIAILCKTGLI
jgi:hypothetical protein